MHRDGHDVTDRVRVLTFSTEQVRCGIIVMCTPAWRTGDLCSIPGPGMLYFRCKNLALNMDCVYLCLSGNTLKAVGPFYIVYMPGEVKYPHRG